MMFAFRSDLVLVATMLMAWTSCGVQADNRKMIQNNRRLRGKPESNTRKEYHESISHQHILDTRPQQAAPRQARKLPVNEQRQPTNNIDIIDEQEESPDEAIHRQKRRNDKSKIKLPSGTLGRAFNSSLYEELANAPFEIYESAFDIRDEEREDSFPVFIVQDWRKDTTGVYSGYSRTATSFTFQNMKVLLTWNDIVEASTGADRDLSQFIQRNKFEASLFIGKTLDEHVSHVPFLGLIVSYHQKSQKNILVPFGKLENFFDDTSEKYFMSDSVQHLEHDALHELLDAERLNNNSTSSFFHPEIVANTRNSNRKEQLEDLEAIHFRKLYQLLIRRTFLFSFGYADCLREEPHSLRACLDDTFALVIQMEATVREALDDELIQELAKITELTKDSKLREACVSVTPGSFGMNECGTGGSMPLSTLAASTLR